MAAGRGRYVVLPMAVTVLPNLDRTYIYMSATQTTITQKHQ